MTCVNRVHGHGECCNSVVKETTMVAKRGTKTSTGKKLKVKKETIRTLEVRDRDKATKVKGGRGNTSLITAC